MQGIKKNCFDWKRWLQESSISVRGKSNLWGYELLLITVCILVLYEISESMHPAVSGVAEIVLL